MMTRINQQTATQITVDTAERQALDDSGGKWVTICEDHSTIMNSATKRLAMQAGIAPADWCEGCRAYLESLESETA